MSTIKLVKVFAERSEDLLFCNQYKFSFDTGERAKRAQNFIAGRQNKTDGGRNTQLTHVLYRARVLSSLRSPTRRGRGGDYCEHSTLTSKYSDEFGANRQEGNQCYFVGKL